MTNAPELVASVEARIRDFEAAMNGITASIANVCAATKALESTLSPEEAADLEAGTYGQPVEASREGAETEKVVISFDVRIAEFEHALEHQFKPALRKAIADVACEFLDNFGDLADIREERA